MHQLLKPASSGSRYLTGHSKSQAAAAASSHIWTLHNAVMAGQVFLLLANPYSMAHLLSRKLTQSSTSVVRATAAMLMQVPADASVLDVVFSDSSSPNSGFWDTNHGLGYHVPITGSSVPQPSLSIVHVSVEMAPIAKVSAHHQGAAVPL